MESSTAASNMNGGCKIHGPAVLADQLGVGVPLGTNSPLGVTNNPTTQVGAGRGRGVKSLPSGGMMSKMCPEVIRAFEGVRYIAENTRREEESVRVSQKD